jgi:hypothetical protein
MGKYGEFTIIINKNRGGILNKFYYDIFGLSNEDESYYKYNDDIIYTFYDNFEQSYSEREIYTATNDYENRYFYFDNKYHELIIHPLKISTSICIIDLKIPKYVLETNSYVLNFTKIFNEIPVHQYVNKIINSKYNCIYTDYFGKKNIFSIVKYKTSELFPSFIFYYDDTILNKKDVIYLIKKIINLDFE